MALLDDMLSELEHQLGEAEAEEARTRLRWTAAQEKRNNRRAALEALRAIRQETPEDGEPLDFGFVQPPKPRPESSGTLAPLARRLKRLSTKRDIVEVISASEFPDLGMSLDELVDQFTRRGWTESMDTPKNALRQAADRLVRSGDLWRPQPSWYALPPTPVVQRPPDQNAMSEVEDYVPEPTLSGSFH